MTRNLIGRKPRRERLIASIRKTCAVGLAAQVDGIGKVGSRRLRLDSDLLIPCPSLQGLGLVQGKCVMIRPFLEWYMPGIVIVNWDIKFL